MRKASFGVASLLVIIMTVASCVSNSAAQFEADGKCSRDIECVFECKHGGFCDLKTGRCSCLPAQEQAAAAAKNVVSIVDANCRRDPDCAKVCPRGCKITNCLNGTCFCEC
ncbi:putative defensin-like protein 263 [Herrania umbratica]|uniref:Defensin-like protein 263 n=1 Tax=Herrania umbratica TaxID=108875 RepID=A0A6J1B245_9ROSI|nr:putative defensin-like protein 263 [Herrania umbratica]